MKSLKVQLTGVMLLAVAFLMPAQAMAQWGIGLSYQIREESPKHGFGIRLEREILQKLPLIELGLRAHFAFFNEENEVTSQGVTFSTKAAYYDYGLGAYAGVSLGFLKPYVGLGIGASTIDVEFDNSSESKSAFSWSGFVGLELTPIPKINPFIEYRFEPVDEAENAFDDLDEELFNSDGRLIIGLSISF